MTDRGTGVPLLRGMQLHLILKLQVAKGKDKFTYLGWSRVEWGWSGFGAENPHRIVNPVRFDYCFDIGL